MPGKEEVWLGLAGDLCSPGVLCDHYTTRIGGAPAFPGATAPWSTSSDGPTCRVCGVPLSLVLQAYAPLPDLPDRMLLVLGCTKAGCGKSSGCWQAVRCQLQQQCTQQQQEPDMHPVQPEELAQQPSTAAPAAAAAPAQGTGFDAGADDWGFGAADSGWGDAQPAAGGSNNSAFDFSDLTSSLAATVQQQQQHQQREAQRKREQKKQQQAEAAAAAEAAVSVASCTGAAGPQLPEFYVLAELEPGASGSNAMPSKELQHVQQLLQAYEATEGACAAASASATAAATGNGSSSERPVRPAAAAAGSADGAEGDGGVSWAGEEYEPDSVQCMQRSYLKFMKRLARQPQQCARYSRGGPLLWPKAQAPQPQPCPSCGGPRVFEVQLMPALSQVVLEAAGMAAEQGIAVDADVVNAVANWEWCTVAVFTCQASCSATSGQNDGSACHTAIEEVLLVTEAECENQHASQAGAGGAAGPAGEEGGHGGDDGGDGGGDDDEGLSGND